MFKLRSALVALALVASAAVAVVSLSPPAKAIDPGTAALVAGGMRMAQAVMHPQQQRPPQYRYGYEQPRPVYRYRYGYQQRYYQQRRYVAPQYYGYQQRRVVRNSVPYYPPAVVSAPRYNAAPVAQGGRENMTVVGFNPGTSQCLAPKRIVPSNNCSPRPDGGMRCTNVCM